MRPSGGQAAQRWLRLLAAGAAVLACAACGGSANGAAEPELSEEREPASEGAGPGVDRAGADSCPEAYDGYLRAWTRWFEVEIDDQEAVDEVVAAFREQLPMRSGLAEMREVAVELRYEPGFERWRVALDATEHAIEVCGEGARRPGS